MTTTTDRVNELFADARELYADALEMLAQDRIRNAADKSWCAVKRATGALILARTGQEPSNTHQTSAGSRSLGQQSDALASLRSRFSDYVHHLHVECFYNGHCEPEDYIVGLIRDTGNYIRDAEASS
ncbi:MAG: hypothetical protein F4X66_15665 [Chloroflexi bacterium]|nr:hypothetical protein [Chloroflexota bacterium]MYE40068.1 hypothetical protein [Chloroflexota bacterium]